MIFRPGLCLHLALGISSLSFCISTHNIGTSSCLSVYPSISKSRKTNVRRASERRLEQCSGFFSFPYSLRHLGHDWRKLRRPFKQFCSFAARCKKKREYSGAAAVLSISKLKWIPFFSSLRRVASRRSLSFKFWGVFISYLPRIVRF